MRHFDRHGLKLQTVLVIGGTGPLGASICKSLNLAGYVPVSYDRPQQSQNNSKAWGPVVHGTPLQKNNLASAIAEYLPSSIIIGDDWCGINHASIDPVQAYRNALTGTLTILELAIANGIQDVILISNAAIFGDAGPVPIREDQPAAPITIAGSCHMICERMIEDFANAHAIRYAILRGFALAGIDDDIAEIVKDDRSMIAEIIAVAAGVRQKLTIRGSNHTTRDGTIIRDYVHATDFANAVLFALRALEAGTSSRIYNIGSGIGTSTLELVHLAERVSGRRVPITYGPKRPDEPPVLVADSSLARVILGWTPKQSATDQIIRTMWGQWYRRHIEPFEDKTNRIAG